MSDLCRPEFVELANRLGGIDCDGANPLVSLRAPWTLDNWTLPVVEVLMIAGAALGLVHGLRLARRHGRSAWLGSWIATVVFVLCLEPFLYFPHKFGLDEHVGLVFAHNTFSIGFLYDRLPLYIIALYPATIHLSHVLVDRAGVFRRRGILVGAVAVGVVNHAFYEIFDHIGPQLRWWAWNADAPSTGPFFASVPLTSKIIFATMAPAIVVALARRLLFTPEQLTSRAAIRRGLLAGVVTPLLLPLASLPVSIVDPDAHETLARAAYWGVLGAMVGVALWALATSRPRPSEHGGFIAAYPWIHGGAHLAVFAVLWATALPDLLDARDGLTASGTPIGSPLYAAGCAALCTWVLVRTAAVRHLPPDPPGPDEASTSTPGRALT